MHTNNRYQIVNIVTGSMTAGCFVARYYNPDLYCRHGMQLAMHKEIVTSTSIHSIGYDRKSKVLEVTFLNTGTYQYFDVPQKLYNDFRNASSKGTFFNTVIKDNYRFLKLS